MALLGEQLVDEWLNRIGFFTLRGIKRGVHEIDLLGIRMSNGVLEDHRKSSNRAMAEFATSR